MLWLNLVLLTAFMGVVSGDASCLFAKSQSCKAKFTPEFEHNEGCEVLLKIVECLNTAYRECGEDSNPELEEATAFLTEMCRPGSESNKIFLKHKDCILEAMKKSVGCFDKAKELIEELLKKSLPTQEDFFRFGCEQANEIHQCVFKEIKDSCGQEAEEFARKGFEPDRKLSKKACEEKGYYFSAGRNTTPTALNISLLSILILISKLFF